MVRPPPLKLNMRCVVVVMCTFLCSAASAAKPKLKVFVLAGQSNMEGQAEVEQQWPNGTEKNGTLLYQTRDPRTAAEFAQTLDPHNKSAWRVRDDVWVWFNENGKSDTGSWGNLSTRFGCSPTQCFRLSFCSPVFISRWLVIWTGCQ